MVSQATTPSLLAAAGEMAHAPQRQHLGAVFRRGHMAHLLAPAPHGRLLRADEAVGVDLQLQAAIAEDALGHDRDHVDIAMPAGDDEGRGLVIGIGGAGADAGDESLAGRQQRSLPFPGAEEGHHGPLLRLGMGGDDHRVHAGQHALDIAVAVAGAGAARPDAAEHGAGIAGDDALGGVFDSDLAHSAALRGMAASTRSGVAGTLVTLAPVAWWIAPSMAGAVGISAGSPMPLAP